MKLNVYLLLSGTAVLLSACGSDDAGLSDHYQHGVETLEKTRKIQQEVLQRSLQQDFDIRKVPRNK